MNKLRKNDLQTLQNIFNKYPAIQAVYLFGSTATGKMHTESDIDLAVITDDKRLRDQKLEILTELARNGFCNVDLVFPGNDDIVLQFEAVRQNIIIYQKPEFDRGATYSKIIRKYLDFYPYLTVQRQAYKQRILNGKI